MKNPLKKPSWWDEFLAFAVKGNAMALAVGTIIGLYIEANKSPKGEVDEQEKKEAGESKNA